MSEDLKGAEAPDLQTVEGPEAAEEGTHTKDSVPSMRDVVKRLKLVEDFLRRLSRTGPRHLCRTGL